MKEEAGAERTDLDSFLIEPRIQRMIRNGNVDENHMMPRATSLLSLPSYYYYYTACNISQSD